MTTMIDTDKMNPAFKENRFRYGATVSVDEVAKKTTAPKHHILTRKKGTREKWTFLGNLICPLEYPTEAAARDDVRKLNKWAAS